MKSGKWSGQMFSFSNFWEFDALLPPPACSLGPLFRKSISIYPRSAPEGRGKISKIKGLLDHLNNKNM